MSGISKVTPYIAKAIGLGGMYCLISDAISDGKRFGKAQTDIDLTNDLLDTIVIHNKSGDTGPLTEHLQEGYFLYLLDSNIRNTLRYIKNRTVSTISQLEGSVPTLVLSLGALLTATKSKIPGLKGKIPAPIGKLCALGVLALNIGPIFSKAFGWGQKDDIYLLTDDNI